MTSATDAITQLKTNTAQYQAKTDTLTGAAKSSLTQSDFLQLLTEQLQYQDPMSPMDNAQFVSQTNQFAQLQAQTDISQTLSNSTAASQATSLVGESVTLKDPNNSENTITGKVTSALINGAKSAITVNGTAYPLSSLLKVNDPTADTANAG